MNAMTHKGYTAKIEFDDRDGIFVGRILDRRAIVGFHGETVTELRSAFETAVDAFLRGGCDNANTKQARTHGHRHAVPPRRTR